MNIIFWVRQHSGLGPEDLSVVENVCHSICKENQPFERLEMKKEDLLKMFAYNEFKCRIIRDKIDTPTTTVYRCGPLIDLCRGPHVRHTVSRELFSEEAAKRDHRKLGVEQKLFFFHELSPGSCFFLPAGAHIYNTLVSFIRSEYWKRGFQEVITPNIYNSALWEQSGHWQHYSENLFKIEVEKQTFGLKPMNCPGHCLMYAKEIRSHKELPLRFADFGVLHRNEFSGALSGLTRVRRFQQDDAHIFCREDQQLKESLDEVGLKWELNPGDGAFYGPKIDITIMDALRRRHQCATIQLDFQLPVRFNLSYASETDNLSGSDNYNNVSNTTNGISDHHEATNHQTDLNIHRPVIIHRAILGSVERIIAILTESYGGKWPFWLSPRQVLVVPVVSACDEYAIDVKNRLHDAGFMVSVDTDPGRTLNKKIRNGQLLQNNFILVVGEKEITNGTVNVRTRDNKVHGEHPVEHVIERFRQLAASRTLEAEQEF
ncbi:threonyl-tRNA synthetase [Schistosoma bovis]|uniref:threonine--tRNA ligase n=1 Tax=Schistosoma bovis TaxID=6184 RepID=A0A430Q699_SCHBO|nr:threonyl-tRNA synthetase [Schistosoma bovis]